MSRGDTGRRAKRAAAYVRMSPEHLNYSTSKQMVIIGKYAKRCRLRIVQAYSNDGKSGHNTPNA